MNKIRLGKEIKALSNEINRYVSESINLNNENRYTTIQFLFMDYIGTFSSQRAVFQRDLETEFNIRRSTATGILQGLEKSQLIIRQSYEPDARLKIIVLTSEGTQIYQNQRIKIDGIGHQLVAGISDDELLVFQSVMNQIYANIAIQEKKLNQKGATICD